MKSLLVLALGAPLAALALTPRLAEPIDAGPQALFVESHAGPRTRDEVRDELERARAGGMLTPQGEIGDTPEVLAARETFAELQREVMLANQDRLVAMRYEALREGDRLAPLPAYTYSRR